MWVFSLAPISAGRGHLPGARAASRSLWDRTGPALHTLGTQSPSGAGLGAGHGQGSW